jgi:hypothetical protein
VRLGGPMDGGAQWLGGEEGGRRSAGREAYGARRGGRQAALGGSLFALGLLLEATIFGCFVLFLWRTQILEWVCCLGDGCWR